MVRPKQGWRAGGQLPPRWREELREISGEFGPLMELVVERAERLEDAMGIAVGLAVDLMERLEAGPLRGAVTVLRAAEDHEALTKAKEEACRTQMQRAQVLWAKTEEKRRQKEAAEKAEQNKRARWDSERNRCPILLPLTAVSKESLQRFPNFFTEAAPRRSSLHGGSSRDSRRRRPRSASALSSQRLSSSQRDVFW